MQLKLTNSLTGKKEKFIPLRPGEVSIYVCGVTLYDDIHIGHLKSIVAFEIMRNYFKAQGLKVTFVRNITDIDDKIIAKAQTHGQDPLALVNGYIDKYHKLLSVLSLPSPDIEPRVTQYLPQIDTYIQDLLDKGVAYEAEDGIYFDSIATMPEIYPLSKKISRDLEDNTRLTQDYAKKNKADFALWKKDEDYGYLSNVFRRSKGRPGWHIECSVMHHHTLGKEFDIHGGGRDLIFPHHENEIVQSMAHNHVNPARYWVHNGMMTRNGEKLSKSLGNSIYVHELLKNYSPESLKLFLSKAHYANAQEYQAEELLEAESRLKEFYQKVNLVLSNETEVKNQAGLPEKFLSALEDDFNTPLALCIVYEKIRLMKTYTHAQEILNALKMLCVFPETMNLEELDRKWQAINRYPEEIEKLLASRQSAKLSGNYALADSIRQQINDSGWEVRDSRNKQGSTVQVFRK